MMETAGTYFKKGDELTRRHEFAEAEQWYLKAVSVLEPTIVIIMTVLVGVVLLSVMLPLLGILSEMML